MIYGYATKKVDEYGLLELREVTITAPPEVLRDIAKFLQDMADLIESDQLAHSSHRHIQSLIGDWDQRFPAKDIASPCADR